MCGQWGESGITKKQSVQYIREELSLDELKAIMDDLSSFKPNITLFGGEPLLHPSCLELIRYIKGKGMHCLLITNGSLLEKFARGLVESGLDELNVSLDGGRDLHDEIRGMPGLFDTIADGLRAIRRFKKEMGLKRPLINLQCTITKYNYRRLEELLKVCEDVGADSITFHNLIFLSEDLIENQKSFDEILNSSSADWEGFIFAPDIDPEELYKKIRSISSTKHRFQIDFYPNFSLEELMEYYSNCSYLPSEYPARCISPWMVAYIFPDGEIRSCLNFTYSYGNLKKDRFSELWNDEKAARFRKTLKANRLFPVCVRCTELYRY